MPAVGTKKLKYPTLPVLVIMFGVVLAIGASRPAVAGVILDEPIFGGSMLVAEDGSVSAAFIGSDAGYFNTLYLDGMGDPLFNKRTDPGSSIDLGWFSAGTELVFRLDVRKTEFSEVSQRFYTGDAGRNTDLIAHASATTTLLDEVYVTTVGFEDLLGGGDLDFNDFKFRLTNVIDPPAVPTPPVLALLGIGLAGIGYRRRKQIRAA